MKRHYYLMMILLMAQSHYCLAQALANNFSTEQELADLPLEELVKIKISGVSRMDEGIAQVPMSVYVVTADDMQRWGVRNWFETLGRVPGYSFYNTDYYGQYGVVSRGLQSVWRFGMSIELMPLNDWGHFVMPKRFFKAVEIARGPAGLMWGSAAEAGLFNFQIRDDLNEKTEATLELGNHGREAISLVYGAKFGEENSGDYFFVGWHGEKQDYVTQDNAYDTPGLTWRENGLLPSYSLLTKIQFKKIKLITWFERASHVSPDIWYADRTTATQIQNELDRLNGPAHDDMDIEAVRAEYHLLNNESHQLYLYSDYFRRNWRTEGIYSLVDRTTQMGFASINHLLNKKLELAVGGNLYKRTDKNAPHGTTALAQSYNLDFVGNSPFHTSHHYNDIYLQARYELSEKVGVLGGSRADNQSSEPLIFSNRLGVFYNPSKDYTFKYLLNSSRRRPQGNELDQGLSPETLVAHELVAIVNPNDAFNANVTLYTQTLTEQMVRINNGSFNTFSNAGSLTSNGIEWGINYKPTPSILTYWNGSYQISKVKAQTLLVNNVPTVSTPHDGNNRPLLMPKFTSFLGSEVAVTDYLKVNGALRTIYDIPYADTSGKIRTASINFIDATLRTRKLTTYNLELSFAVLNLLDNQNRVPAIGEHSNNAPGTLAPEGRRYQAQVSTTF